MTGEAASGGGLAPSRTETRSAEETFELARRLAASFTGDEVILLVGELGAGKTVFAKGLAAGAGVQDPDRVASPTFTLINIYDGRWPVFHVDLYRLTTEAEILELGWDDLLGKGIVIVEWGERFPLEVEALRVEIEVTGDSERRITVRSTSVA